MDPEEDKWKDLQLEQVALKVVGSQKVDERPGGGRDAERPGAQKGVETPEDYGLHASRQKPWTARKWTNQCSWQGTVQVEGLLGFGLTY